MVTKIDSELVSEELHRIRSAYYHLIAMCYPEELSNSIKPELTKIFKNKNNQDRYKEAYLMLSKCNDKSQKLFIEHREKAKIQLAQIIPESERIRIEHKREMENKGLVRAYLTKINVDEVETKFIPANKLLDNKRNYE